VKRLLEHKFINLMSTPYHPPFTFTSRQVSLVAEICERIGRWGGRILPLYPQLRKANRIQSIQTDQVSDQVSVQVAPDYLKSTSP
jgi:hypothetical protein